MVRNAVGLLKCVFPIFTARHETANTTNEHE